MKKMLWGLCFFSTIFIACEGILYASDWSAGIDSKSGEFVYAATVNDSGSLFGQYCFKSNKSCLYLLAMTVACNPGNKYPVLVNSDIGSYVLQIYCFDKFKDGLYRYSFTNFDDIDGIVKRASRVGFAVPMEGDQFKVIRFSLFGANKALAEMQGQANKVLFKKVYNRSEEDL